MTPAPFEPVTLYKPGLVSPDGRPFAYVNSSGSA
jgi:hypothetical protein